MPVPPEHPGATRVRIAFALRWLFFAVFPFSPAAWMNAGEFGPNVPPSRRAELMAEVRSQISSADELWSFIQKWANEEAARAAAPMPPLLTASSRTQPASRERAIEVAT